MKWKMAKDFYLAEPPLRKFKLPRKFLKVPQTCYKSKFIKFVLLHENENLGSFYIRFLFD